MRSFHLMTCLVTIVAVSAEAAADFETDVAPILIKRCLECHKGQDASGGLSLESAAGLRRGGESGAAVIAGKPADSYLIQRVVAGEMPPPVKGVAQKLPDVEVAILSDWITKGTAWPEERRLDLYEVTTDVRGGRDWWSFQPVQRPSVPEIMGSGVANPIDAFILAKLKTNEFEPAPPAGRRRLIRRMYYDVIGLPPSFEELEKWSAADNMTLLVDHLLSSPHFGERWARYWLDLVRYAETSGYERDQPKPFAWKYRDWVVNAINADMPYDRFIRHQLAGDEIEGRDEQSVIGTGFLRLGTWNDEPNDDADYRYERLEDMVHTASSAFLGLTVKCARCHDHKFDPIPQEDYYKIASAFWPGPVAARDRKLLGGPSAEELGVENILGWTDLIAQPAPLHVLKNGERDKPLNAVQPASLSFAAALTRTFEPAAEGAKTTGRRRQLADWIASPENPLTARVFVNRLWQHHFGEGLVRSPSNFGFKGERPTHPELLDWLASEFIDNGWSARHIHRLILTSRTWQQSSVHPKAVEYLQRDSANRYLWKAGRRRLDAEALRDSMLAASGEIDLRIGGEGFKPTISEEALEGFSRKGAVWKAASPDEQRRRSLYIFVSRSLMPPMMTTFDQCDTTLPCAARDVTTVAPQALAMMNNHFTHARSTALAKRIEQTAATDQDQVVDAWKFALGRKPFDRERALAEQHLKSQTRRFALTKDQPDEGSQQIPEPVLHLAADFGVTAGADGRVSEWKGRSGEHHAAQVVSEAQPVVANDAINGQPALRFDGRRQFLRIKGEVLSDEDCTIIAVASDQATKPGLREILSNWNRSSNVVTSVFLGLRDTNGIRFSDSFNAAGTITDRRRPFVLTARNSPHGAHVWQNASLTASRTQPVTGRKFGTEWVIGQQGNINGEYWHGDIAEVLVFDRPLSQLQLAAVWKQLHSKYQIPMLPASSESQDATSPEHKALASLCHVLLNSNEFLYVD